MEKFKKHFNFWAHPELREKIVEVCKRYIILIKKEVKPFNRKYNIPDDFDPDSNYSEKRDKEYDEETVERWGCAWATIQRIVFKRVAKNYPELKLCFLEDEEEFLKVTADNIHFDVSYRNFNPTTAKVLSSFCGSCGRNFEEQIGG